MQTSKQFVKDLKDRDSVLSTFLAVDRQILKDRNGKPYMSLNLADATGSINARIWEKVEDWQKVFEPGDFVKVKGHVQTYQSRKQIIVHDVEKMGSDQIDLKDFVVRSALDPQLMWKQLLEMVESIDNDHVRELSLRVLNRPGLKEQMLKAPAAKSIHHAYLGGLLEHVLSIAQIMNFLAGHYTSLDRSLLLFGALFHDLGKLWELSVEEGIKYTNTGRLVGHMVIICEVIDETVREIHEFPLELKDVLKHIVLSHHGKLEFGSPKEPMLPEAVMVAMIDDLDSKMNTILGFMMNELSLNESWTRLHPQFSRYFYLDFLRRKHQPKE